MCCERKVSFVDLKGGGMRAAHPGMGWLRDCEDHPKIYCFLITQWIKSTGMPGSQ